MQLDFLNVLFTVIFLVILTVPGFLLAKFKVIGENADSVISSIILYLAQPMLMITSFQKTSFNTAIALNMLIVFGLVAVIHGIMIGLMFLFVKGKETRHNCIRTASVFGNCGYMGLPFIELVFSGEAQEVQGAVMIYAAVAIAVFNIFNWSVGIFMISGDKKNINIKNALLNPTIISIIIGVILFLICQKPIAQLATKGSVLYSVLEKLMKSIGYLADMVTPLAMMVIGVKLAKVKPKQLFCDKNVYISSFNKLIIMSLVSILVVSFLPIDIYIKTVVFFTMSMPCATSTVLFAVLFNGDNERASITVLVSTLLSILTIPVMFELFKLFI